jgi:acetoin utilization protein AcuB
MLISEIMSTDLVTVGEAADLEEALQQMLARKVRHLLVVDGGRLVGVITDRDLRFALPSRLANIGPAEREAFMRSTRVGAVCIRKPVTATPQTDVRDAAVELRQRRIGCLPVLDGERLVGIVTVTDILDAFIDLTAP